MRMNKLRESCRCSVNRVALSLVEVVLALLLLASLLVGMITASGLHHQQIRRAELRLQAVAAAEQLLAEWYDGPRTKVPRRERGLLRGQSEFLWQTVPTQRTFIETLPVEIVRLQVFSGNAVIQETEPLVQLDLLIPIREESALR